MMGRIVYLLEIYYAIWWTVLFCILPFGVTTYADAGIEVTDGGDPGAPINPRLKQKAWTTTWVSAVVFAVGYALWASHLFHLPSLPTG